MTGQRSPRTLLHLLFCKMLAVVLLPVLSIIPNRHPPPIIRTAPATFQGITCQKIATKPSKSANFLSFSLSFLLLLSPESVKVVVTCVD